VDYVHQHIPHYKDGEHIMFTMGDDFHYQNARMNFHNMDKAGGSTKLENTNHKGSSARDFGP
jgi:hypothetical protein